MSTIENDSKEKEEIKNLKHGCDNSVNSGLFLTFDRFQNWIHCICLTTFDIEIGQAIEVNLHFHPFFSFLYLIIL